MGRAGVVAVVIAALAVSVQAGIDGMRGSMDEPSYDPSFGLETAYYAATAYCNSEEVDNWKCGAPCEKNAGVGYSKLVHATDVIGDTWAVTLYNNRTNEIIVGFRGTDGVSLTEDSIRNWLTNLDAVMTSPFNDMPEVKTHRGFWLAYQLAAKEIISTVGTLLKENSKAHVRVVGHSLGGALATLCATDLRRQFPDDLPIENLRVMTFGMPRVGNTAFVEYYTKEITNSHFRIVHKNDIVPHVPTEWMGFLHVPQEVWYHDDAFKDYTVCKATSTEEDKSCSDSVDLLKYSIPDHMKYFIPVSGSCSSSVETII